jgi:hypothetical protein
MAAGKRQPIEGDTCRPRKGPNASQMPQKEAKKAKKRAVENQEVW